MPEPGFNYCEIALFGESVHVPGVCVCVRVCVCVCVYQHPYVSYHLTLQELLSKRVVLLCIEDQLKLSLVV